MVDKVTFLDFKVRDRPPESALFRGSIGSKNALFGSSDSFSHMLLPGT